ncbi:MAG: DUF4926 domain-containing protein [Hyphomicrobiaceae bacterium]
MIEELEIVALTRAVPQHRLEAGDVGTVVMVHGASRGYTVEFMDLRGNTLAIADLPADAVRPVREREVAHVRLVA